MRNKAPLSSTFSVAVALLTCVALAAGVLTFLRFFLNAFLASQPPVQAAVIAGSVTIWVSVATLIYNARSQKKREIDAEHRKKKAEIYEGYIAAWFDLMRSQKNEGTIEEDKVLELVITFSRGMVIWGSDTVIKAYIDYKNQFGQQEEPDPIAMVAGFENIIFAMRKDLGHDNKNLGQSDLLSLFVVDIAQILKAGGEGESVKDTSN